MQLQINLDLQSIITKAVSAERIQPIVDKAISEAITSAIRDATDYSSEFRKLLKEQLAQASRRRQAIPSPPRLRRLRTPGGSRDTANKNL